MKSTTLYEAQAMKYFTTLSATAAKQTLFVMANVSDNRSMKEASLTSLQEIGKIYDTANIDIKMSNGKKLAEKFAAAYNTAHPGALMNKKGAEQYTHYFYRNIVSSFGLYGLDYLLTMLEISKARNTMPDSGIDERALLMALRWSDRRPYPPEQLERYNKQHRLKGLELLGFSNEEAALLLPHTCDIALMYERTTANAHGIDFTAEEAPAKEQPNRILEMKMHFLKEAAKLNKFYAAKKPVIPAGFDGIAIEGSVIELAKKGLVSNSSEILEYVANSEAYAALLEMLEKTFSSQELEVILNKAERVQALIAVEW